MIGTYVLSAGFYDAYLQPRPQGPRVDQTRLRLNLRCGRRRDPDACDTFGRLWSGRYVEQGPVEMYLLDACSP